MYKVSPRTSSVLDDDNRVVKDERGNVRGDIDLLFTMKESMRLIELFPTGVAYVQHKKTMKRVGNYFLSTGDIIVNSALG